MASRKRPATATTSSARSRKRPAEDTASASLSKRPVRTSDVPDTANNPQHREAEDVVPPDPHPQKTVAGPGGPDSGSSGAFEGLENIYNSGEEEGSDDDVDSFHREVTGLQSMGRSERNTADHDRAPRGSNTRRGPSTLRHQLTIVLLFQQTTLTPFPRLRHCIRPLSAGLIWAPRTSTRSVTFRWVWFFAPRRLIFSVLDAGSSPSAMRKVGPLKHHACVQNMGSLPLCFLLPWLGADPWHSSCQSTVQSSSQVPPWQLAALHGARVVSLLTYETENAPLGPLTYLPAILEPSCMCLECLSHQCLSRAWCRLPVFGFGLAYPVGVHTARPTRLGWQQLSASAIDSPMCHLYAVLQAFRH